MDKCVFCGWSRRSAYPAIRFFGIPKEPGMKRVQWLYAIGDREVTNKDRVCSVHFRSGRPSSDPSHEDFVPHLFLNREPPPEVLQYLEEIAEMKSDPYAADYEELIKTTRMEHGRTCKPLILKRKHRKVASQPQSSTFPATSKQLDDKPSSLAGTSIQHHHQQQQELLHPSSINTTASKHNQSTSSSNNINTINEQSSLSIEMNQVDHHHHQQHHQGIPNLHRSNVVTMTVPETGQVKRVKLQMLQKPIVEAAGLKPGQTVIIKRRIPVLRTSLQSMQSTAMEERRVPRTQGNIVEGNLIVAEEQTVQ